jgi:nitrogen fixation protein FixH
MDLAFVADAGGGRRGDLTVSFRDGGGGAVTGLAVEARMIRPTHEGYDTTAALGHRGGGVYGAGVTLPLPGQWTVRIHARRGADTFQASHRIQVP